MLERLKILYENTIIDEEVYNNCLNIHKGLMSDEALTETNAYQVAMTHLAMAMQRIKQENVVGYMDKAILSQITESELFDKVEELTTKITDEIHVDMPESEVQFLWLHFLTVLTEKGGN